MDWSRFFPFSLTDLRGAAVFRQAAILGALAVILFLGTGILYNLLKLQLIRTKPAPAAVERTKAAAVAVREPLDAYQIIPVRNLFGTTTSAVAEPQATAVQPPVIEQLFALKGTVAGEGKFGFAIVEEKATQAQRLVRSGDALSGGRIVRIGRREIAVAVGDQVVTLKVTESQEEPLRQAAPSPAPAIIPGATVLSRAELDMELQDMGSLLRKALVRPYFNAGAQEGFIISNIRAGSLYQKMGIMNGDIIQEVNNRKIRTADDVMGLLSTIKAGSSLSMTITRRGNKETLHYQFQ